LHCFATQSLAVPHGPVTSEIGADVAWHAAFPAGMLQGAGFIDSAVMKAVQPAVTALAWPPYSPEPAPAPTPLELLPPPLPATGSSMMAFPPQLRTTLTTSQRTARWDDFIAEDFIAEDMALAEAVGEAH